MTTLYGPAGLGDPHPSYYRRKPDEINQWVENPDGIDTVAEEIADALRAEIEWLRDSNSKLAGHIEWLSNVHKNMRVERDRLLGEVTYLRSEMDYLRERLKRP